MGRPHDYKRTLITILVPSGDQVTEEFSPCSTKDVGVRERYAKTAEGCQRSETSKSGWNLTQRHTRTRQTERPFFVSVQNSDFRGLGERHITGSSGRFGKAGTADSCLAAEVGKYMTERPKILYQPKMLA
jgi:hypothetical protein